MAKANTIFEAASGWASNLVDPDDLRYRLRISVWLRWLVVLAWMIQYHYRPNFSDPTYVPNMLLAAGLLALNGYVHYRIRSNGTVTWHWALALSSVDVLTISAGLAILDGFDNKYFVLYYPAITGFAVVFSSFRLSLGWVTIVAAIYTAMCFTLPAGINFETKDEKVLFIRILTLFAVVAAVNLITRTERIRRMEAVERERELQRERTELTQTIHNTIAQSAYMIDLGIESVLELAGNSNPELTTKLRATHSVSKSAMWELRHTIDAGPIFEGRELGRVLRSHVSAFTAITSIPAELVQEGEEPQLSTTTRKLLFAIAHNAMTNAFRHSGATRVTVLLDFQSGSLTMSVEDDGAGLPEDYAERGHGVGNMRADVERLNGAFWMGPGPQGLGTAVTCSIPYSTQTGDQ